MNVAALESFLLWCVVLNYVVLLVWLGVIVFAHDALYNFHKRWMRVSREQYDMMMYGGMAIYKIGILLLNLIPLIALWIVFR